VASASGVMQRHPVRSELSSTTVFSDIISAVNTGPSLEEIRHMLFQAAFGGRYQEPSGRFSIVDSGVLYQGSSITYARVGQFQTLPHVSSESGDSLHGIVPYYS
jgi:hypothetical protein